MSAPGAGAVEPFYLPLGDEVELFEAASRARMPVLLKGPTGCGKTRFLEAMAWRLGRTADGAPRPLVTVACHEDLTASDLVGRFLLGVEGTRWVDGPLTTAARSGAICYLDEVVEARKDTVVIIHALTDHRRMLPIVKLGTTVEAHPDFQLVISYNPGYQSAIKDLKPSTRQRFVSIEFGYPSREAEAEILARETGIDAETADRLAGLGEALRNISGQPRLEGPSTRLLVYAAGLVEQGLSERDACRHAVTLSLTDDPVLQTAITEVIEVMTKS